MKKVLITLRKNLPYLTLLLLVLFVLVYFFNLSNFKKLAIFDFDNKTSLALHAFSISFLSLKACFFAYLIFLYFRYKSINSIDDKKIPSCTVLVPAYNEGELVYKTLKSIVKSDFPKDRLQIIAIDDGSVDDTIDWIRKAEAEFKGQILVIKQPENKGKRHALYDAFAFATGEVIITVDSDSVVLQDTLRNLVSPFTKDKKCGAVAGNVRVLNTRQHSIPKMLNVSFAYSFEFIRSAQSTVGTVLCTPGALAAYRWEVIKDDVDEWLNQTFLGQACDIGEDRALTNIVLKNGYQVVFQRNAIVYTNTPEKYAGLSKMYIRWSRSNVREDLMMSRFVFNNFREEKKFPARVLLTFQWINTLMAFPALILLIGMIIYYPLLVITTMMFGVLLYSTIPVIFYSRKRSFTDGLWAYTYGVFYCLFLFWIVPYSILTVRKKGWLTR